MIPVTKPFTPPIEDYQKLVEGIWQRNWLTNNGPLVNNLEQCLRNYLDLDHLLFLTNGTIAIQIALRALRIKGDVITTPFSYVATTSSLVWEGFNPVFVDIDPNTLNLDPSKIEEAITPKTTAILATHCFGIPCDVEGIDTIARKHNLKVIYDGAHGFGTRYKGKSIFQYGDISTASFHATKLFHSVEGGAVFTSDEQLLKRMNYLRNFGHDGPEHFNGIGINGKNSEFHAAMGICNLTHIEAILDSRKQQALFYDEILKDLNMFRPLIPEFTDYNYAYYPVVFNSEKIMLEMKAALEKEQVFPRRYFYPSLSNLDYVTKTLTPIADDIAKRILCLPVYHTLTQGEQEMIGEILFKTQNNPGKQMV